MAQLQLRPGQQVVVALGGGADSQSVLALCDQFRKLHPEFQYLAIHLDHAFHENSPQWAEFLAKDCKRRNFPTHIEPLRVPQGARISKEAAGREARYRRLAELTENDAVILLGQHRSDQAETFLLQLKRGAGPKGLSAMAVTADFTAERTLARPLLEFTKDEIYDFANQFELSWIEDDTNTDTSIDRNFLRHEIMPRLKARWPSIEKTIARSSELCAEHEALLQELLEDEMRQRVNDDNSLSLLDWASLSEAKQKAIIRIWLEQLGATLPSQSIMHELMAQLARFPQGKVGVRWASYQVVRVKKSLVLQHND
ncbi:MULTISPECIES: tRNA lysidine(34) synthetase TilS [Gammaproteobacteria]|uniref:tRNA lysidine(34) synthetase TilS n=1 Tax=Gammaproteobacteria TaxID=1236 RepID=UPI000F814CBC|nr:MULTISPECIES: tRNA lysidine(34) synthetase TilS [Gammaproteobacteria]RTE87511.1 tRNA lysidine(34) synthetase TilS [Aliidiomarina sp. B3213]TCZ92704.1 tRNA lysidine(34) synthetase TilS [Lysobacter sp. N42]